MPKKANLPRWQRALNKIGMMPLQPYRKISERFDIPFHKLALVERPYPKSVKTRAAALKRYWEKSNGRKPVFDPRLWVISRLFELASKHNNKEIRQILLREKELLIKEKKYPQLHSVKIPTEPAISSLLRQLDLQTNERRLARYEARRRPLNKLTDAQREQLVQISNPFIQRMREWAGKTGGEELADIIEEYIKEDIKYVQIEPDISATQQKARWLAYLTKGRRFFYLKGLNLLERKNKKEKRIQLDEAAIPNELSEEKTDFEIPTNVKLTEKQRRVFELLKQGMSRKQIAKVIGTGRTNVDYLIKQIRVRILLNR